jgi:hypothetical protein
MCFAKRMKIISPDSRPSREVAIHKKTLLVIRRKLAQFVAR